MYCCSTGMGEEGGTHVNTGTSEPQKKTSLSHSLYRVSADWEEAIEGTPRSSNAVSTSKLQQQMT
jgi:hypothetical protein